MSTKNGMFLTFLVMVVVLFVALHFAKIETRERVYIEIGKIGSEAHDLALQVQGCKPKTSKYLINY